MSSNFRADELSKMTDHMFYRAIGAAPFFPATVFRVRGVVRSARDDQNNDDDNGKDEFDSGVATKTRPKTKRPSMYRVLLLNDDYTPMEFVVMVLQDIFNMTSEDSWQVMMHVHKQGVGECGVFPYEVAETKVTRVMDAARKHQHPLQCVMEKK